MKDLSQKFEELKHRLLDPKPASPVSTDSSILFVYDPDQERTFLAELNSVVLELQRKIPLRVLDLATFPFEVLSEAGRLEDAFQLEFEDYRGLRQYLAASLHTALIKRIKVVDTELSGGAIFLTRTASLFPWISYSGLLQDLRTEILNARLVIAFPGTDSGAKLHFLNAKDGYNYLATRI